MNHLYFLTEISNIYMEEDRGSPTATDLLGSGLLFIQQNIVGSCSPNIPQILLLLLLLLLLLYSTVKICIG